MTRKDLTLWLSFSGKTLLRKMLIMGRAIGIGEHWRTQIKFESFPVYNAEGAVAVIQPKQKLSHLPACVISAKSPNPDKPEKLNIVLAS